MSGGAVEGVLVEGGDVAAASSAVASNSGAAAGTTTANATSGGSSHQHTSGNHHGAGSAGAGSTSGAGGGSTYGTGGGSAYVGGGGSTYGAGGGSTYGTGGGSTYGAKSSGGGATYGAGGGRQYGSSGGGHYGSYQAAPRKDFEVSGVNLEGGSLQVMDDAKKYNEQEQTSILATFKKWDAAGTGYISEPELRRVLTALGVKSSQVKAIFDEVDKNGDQKIDYQEFVKWCYQPGTGVSSPIKQQANIISYALQIDYFEIHIHQNWSWDWWSDWVDTPNGESLAPYCVFRHPVDKKKVYYTSPCGSGFRSMLEVHKFKVPVLCDFTTVVDCDRIAIDMYISRIRGHKFVGTGEMKLLDIAPELARGLTETRKFIIQCTNDVKNPQDGKMVKATMGQVVLKLKQTEFHAPWETLKVQYWKRDGLPQCLSTPTSTVAYDLLGVVKSLAVCPDKRLEEEVMGLIAKQALLYVQGVENNSVAYAGDVLTRVSSWLLNVEEAAKKQEATKSKAEVWERNQAVITKTKQDVTSDVLSGMLRGSSQKPAMMKVGITFALALDSENRFLNEAADKFKAYLNLPKETSLADMLAASSVDATLRDPAVLGLTVETSLKSPPEIDDFTRFGIRDQTIEHVLRLVGWVPAPEERRNMSSIFEAEMPKMMQDPNLKLPDFVKSLLSKVIHFCGEKPMEQFTIPEMILSRQRDLEALLGRYDVVAAPCLAEYDQNWQRLADLSGGTEGGGMFSASKQKLVPKFGENPAAPIGGRGWFWVLHAAAMNIGESTNADDFQEYTREADPTFKVGRWLDEDRYIADMAALWRNALLAAVHLGIQDMIVFPFGMGAFLRNLNKNDDRYCDDAMMRRLRTRVADGLYAAAAECSMGATEKLPGAKPMNVHVCLIDADDESRVNHNVFVESAAAKVKEIPALAKQLKFHQNADCLHLANQLASAAASQASSQETPCRVGMLNGANNKLLGNHWFSHGARHAIDENFHRRSSTMCLASVLINQATAPCKRGFVELRQNVEIFGGKVVTLLPPAGCGRRFIPNPVRRTAPTRGGKFLSKVSVSPYGVLGSQWSRTGQTKQVAPEPTPESGIAITDPAGLPFIRSGPGGAGGASGALYKWLDISRDHSFADDVQEGIQAACDAKFHNYPGKCVCIHVVGPNFNEVRCDRNEAVNMLVKTYTNIFTQFIASGATTLRLLPVSSAIFAGSFSDEMPEMTVEALERCLGELDAEQQNQVFKADKLEMCIFNEKEVDVYEEIWSGGARKKAARQGGGAGGWGGGGGGHGGGGHGSSAMGAGGGGWHNGVGGGGSGDRRGGGGGGWSGSGGGSNHQSHQPRRR